MTTMPQPASLANGYTAQYDAWNRLVELKNGTTTVATYRYDGATRRVTKLVGSNTTHFYYSDQWQILEERLNTGSSADRQFVWGQRYIDDLVLRDQSTTRHYVLNDRVNVTSIINTSGTVQERYGYNAFGTSRVMNASFVVQSSSSYNWETRFAAYRWDSESGLYQVRYRYYHPLLGTWINRDPLGEHFDQKLYQFNYNDPISVVDPMGLWGIQFGDYNIGIGNPNLAFDDDSWMDLANGAAATMDGLIPVYDPLADLYQNGDIWSDDYEPVSDWERDLFNQSHNRGEIAQACLLSSTLFRPLTRARQPITHFGGPLQPGSWVMTGGPTVRNWLMAGAKPNWLLPGNQTVATALPGTLRWPSGWQWIKGFLGQRIYSP
jgi:RHS repeat-associated protein